MTLIDLGPDTARRPCRERERDFPGVSHAEYKSDVEPLTLQAVRSLLVLGTFIDPERHLPLPGFETHRNVLDGREAGSPIQSCAATSLKRREASLR